MNIESDDFIINKKYTKKVLMNQIHFRILFSLEKFESSTEKIKKKRNGIVELNEDETVAEPLFLRDQKLKHTVEARWSTPCVVRAKEAVDEESMCFSVYYHPKAFKLAKNDEFKRIIAENAIKSACGVEYVPKYCILPYVEDTVTDKPLRPRYELCLYSSSSSARQYFQLNVWLPRIISSQSILLECSVTNIYIQTYKPFKYKLTLKWPHQLVVHKIIFSCFIKKEKRLAIVAEKLNLIEESEEETICIESTTGLSMDLPENVCLVSNIPHSLDINISDTCSQPEINVEESYKVFKKVKAKTHLNVKFGSFDSCVVFQDCEPATDISERSKVNVPTKTKDGCSTKRYTYQMNKKAKSDSNNQPNKSNGKNKYNGRKKR